MVWPQRLPLSNAPGAMPRLYNKATQLGVTTRTEGCTIGQRHRWRLLLAVLLASLYITYGAT